MPNRLGRVSRVDWGFGSPVHIRLPTSGTFQHVVPSTDSMNQRLKASVLTAR